MRSGSGGGSDGESRSASWRRSSGRRSTCSPSSAGRCVDATEETFGPAGTLGRDSTADVVLVHRLRGARSPQPRSCPSWHARRPLAEFVKDRSRMDRVAGEQGRLRPPSRRLPDVVAQTTTATTSMPPSAYVDFRDAEHERLARGVPGPDRRRAPQPAPRPGPLRQRHPARARRVQGSPSRPSAPPTTRTSPTTATRSRPLFVPNAFVLLSNGSEAQGRRDVRAVGVTSATGRSSTPREPGRGRARDRDPRDVRARRELLDLVENFVAYIERPGGLIKVVARNHQYLGVNAADRGPPPRSARAARSGSASSGTRRAPARACRCCGSRRRCSAGSPGRGRS